MRAISVHQLYNTKRNLLELSPGWDAHLGKPEVKGSILIWGGSGNGKTSYALQLAKELAKHERVLYNSVEEGDSESLKLSCKRQSMHDVPAGRFQITEEDYPQMVKRLKRHKSQNVVIIDSLQYMGMDFRRYKSLLRLFPNKLFVWISHQEGKLPEGRTAKRVRYDASIKVRVSGYVANAASRYGGGQEYVIWEEGAQSYKNN